MTDIKWEEPAFDGRRRVKYDWDRILGELRANPGRWALVAEDAPVSMSTNIKKGTYANSVRGEFEAVVRESNNFRGKVYARYVGGAE